MPARINELIPRILVIDDNADIFKDFDKILCPPNSNKNHVNRPDLDFLGIVNEEATAPKHLSVELDFAQQGKDALEMVKKAIEENHPYSVAFCDMRMPPGWNGIETIERIWEVDPSLQAVICSAYSDNNWSEIAEQLGNSAQLLILKKPIDPVEVRQIAASLVEKRKLFDAANLKREELESTVLERTRELRRTNRELDLVLMAINSVMIELDESGIVRRWNETAASLFNINSELALGQQINELSIQWSRASPDWDQDPRNGSKQNQFESTFHDENGKQRIVSFATHQIFDDGIYKGVLILGTDLTDHRDLEQQLQTAQKLESVGQLAAGVAHEINTPLQYVGDNLDFIKTKSDKLDTLLGYIQELADEEASENSLFAKLQNEAASLKLSKLRRQIPEALNDSIVGVEHVSKIVRAMKELSHPGGDEKSAVDINRSLETTKTVSTNEWKYVADFEMELAPDLPMVPGLSGELGQVFLNLIVNAAHAIAHQVENEKFIKGQITIRSKLMPEFVRIEIEDNGGGIPEEIRSKVFDPFFTTKAVGKGTGQGLALAHSVISQMHDGLIRFDVVDGVGTTFVIELPLYRTKAEGPLETNNPELAINSQ